MVSILEKWMLESNLTNGQMLLYLGQRLQPNVPLYNMALSFSLSTDIDHDRLQDAIQRCVDEADALRTIVVEEDGVPQQRILPQRTVELQSRQFATMDAARDWMSIESQRVFALDECMFDTALLRLSDGPSIWFVNQHHLITDAWACEVLFRRVADHYAQPKSQFESESKPPQFEEYARYEQTLRLDREDITLEQCRTHWGERKRQANSALRVNGESSSTTGTATVRHTIELTPKRVDQLSRVAQLPQVRAFTKNQSFFSIFSSLLIAWQHRISGRSHSTIGSPVLNRLNKRFKETLGVFIELYPLHAHLSTDETFVSLMEKMRAESNAFLRFGRPGASLPGLQKTFNVVLNYITASFGQFNEVPTKCEWIHCGHGDAAHHLRLQVHDFDATGGITLHFDFNLDVFDEKRQKLVLGQFESLLDALVLDPTQRIATVDLSGGLPDGQAIAESSQANFDLPDHPTVLHSFLERVAETPNEIAVCENDVKLTFQQVEDASTLVAMRIIEAHCQADDSRADLLGCVVGLCVPRSIEGVIAFLGIMKTGAACMPLDDGFPMKRLKFMMEDSMAAHVIVSSRSLRKRPELEQLLPLTVDRDEWIGQGEPASQNASKNKHGQCAPTSSEDAAYVIYTSGSTGKPKGVVIEHGSLLHYASWAASTYTKGEALAFPWFTPLTFDLTITSLFVPLVSGGKIVVYPEAETGSDLALLDVIEENCVDVIKLTPSHLALLYGRDLSDSRVDSLILGGEDLKRELALATLNQFGGDVAIFNEYGPTEATVGCMIHKFSPTEDLGPSVPIGIPAGNSQVFLLDQQGQPVEQGVEGEIYVGGKGVARGYLGRQELTERSFVEHPFQGNPRLYRTGDLAAINASGVMEYRGRIDGQVKVRGVRVELGELENEILSHPKISAAAANVVSFNDSASRPVEQYCSRCGLPSNYPGASYDSSGVCHLCTGFASYQEKTSTYFRNEQELEETLASRPGPDEGYDCMALLSGGKDSTYVLARLVDMGQRVFAFTLDNGFLSSQAKRNISQTVQSLGVDHVFATTPAMNQIFADSLAKHSNVCNGCFKTVYTLAIQKAKELGIPWVVTGLSRGQFFETRLTEELFRGNDFDPDQIDEMILAARKAYHRADDAVNRLIADDCFQQDQIFEDVQFIDFYRYCDVSLEDLYAYLETRTPWTRPTDTGRSTNCLINDVGIYVHKLEKGFHNYAFPYSWDVRIGHKKREAALEELDDQIDEASVKEMLDTVGYSVGGQQPGDRASQLVGYYIADENVSVQELRDYLGDRVPAYLMPNHLIQINDLPLTSNGKLNRNALPLPQDDPVRISEGHAPPEDEVEKRLVEVWSRVLRTPVGVFDNFFDVGGDSILAIQIVSRANELGFNLRPSTLFSNPTISQLAKAVGVSDVAARQQAVSGRIEPLPVQRWFFETVKDSPGQWNQSIVVKLPKSVTRDQLERAFDALAKHHDGVRTRVRGGELWIESESKPVRVAEREGAKLSEGVLENECDRCFDLQDGPLISAVLIRTAGQTNELVIVVHHLVVDALSWPILLKDLSDLLQDRSLPLKSTDIQSWARGLLPPSDELDYWMTPQSEVSNPSRLPRDVIALKTDRPASAIVTTSLTEKETEGFLERHKEPMQQLVSAVLLEYRVLTASDQIGIEFEGHGREELVKDADISRTVGWFTSRFPLWFSVGQGATMEGVLTHVKEAFLKLPRKGVGYGLLRYLHEDDAVKEAFSRLPAPDLLFNYLGHSHQLVPQETLFDLARPLRLHRGQHRDRTHSLEISAGIDAGRLTVCWDYNPAWNSRESVFQFATRALSRLRDQSTSTDRVRPKFDSFPQANLDQKKFDKLAEALKKLK